MQGLSGNQPLYLATARQRLIFEGHPLIVGILNVTPDSFSDGGLFAQRDAAIAQGLLMAQQGADCIDVGGESTRPGAVAVSLKEERRRVIPVLRSLSRRLRLPLSIDTSKARIAEEALEAGAGIINDVTALRKDPRMAAVVARSKAAVILMHMRGNPRMMQHHIQYRDVVEQVSRFLHRATRRAQQAGIDRSRIWIDPGIGFGKTLRHNLQLLRHLPSFLALGFPVMIGPSRKSFLGKILGTTVTERLEGTLACVAHAYACGAHLVRVHDVSAAVRFQRTLCAIDGCHEARRQY
ncbi:MAG: dihydropteroate synthase [Candidatus Omnitrophica bacterium]|nr:dihydropteroate synthase [Candidatus Omnitrophota bacterium]